MSDIVKEKRKINISEFPKELPQFNSSYEPKESLIKKWLTKWILSSVKENKIKENDILPSKAEISEYLGVSSGTVQNAIRYVEDAGLLKSKQKCGTMIAAGVTSPLNDTVKSTTKRDKAVMAVKRIIIQKGYSVGDIIPSARKTAEYLNLSQNTVRLAYEYLRATGYIDYKKTPGRESDRVLVKYPALSQSELNLLEDLFPETLVDKITKSLKSYLAKNFNPGDRIPSNEVFSKQLNVSIKTVHDCIKKLNKEGIIISRRGRYGSILAQNPLKPVYEPLKESSIFAKAEDAAFYSYQKIENLLISLINSNYNAGDKLPSMLELAEKFNVSTNTVRKALINLSQEGYITFGRGRYGGTFVIEKPSDTEKQSFKWLSVNPDYI